MSTNTMPPHAFASNQEKDRWVNWWMHQGWLLHDVQAKLHEQLPLTFRETFISLFVAKLREQLVSHVETRTELRKEAVKIKKHLCSHPKRYREFWNRVEWDCTVH